MPACRGDDDDGFSLVEVLASLLVLSLCSLLLLQGLDGRGAAWARIARQSDDGEGLEAARLLLFDRVQRIWPVTIYYIRPPGPDFRGAPAKLGFLAPPRDADGPGALRRYQLTLTTGGDLVLDSLSDLALDQDHWSARQVLARGVRSLDLAYYGASLTDRSPAWRPEWRDQPTLPALVRIRLGFPEGDQRRWPDLVVHPVADIDAGCILVVDTGGCKGR